MEFEQMLQEAQEPSSSNNKKEGESGEGSSQNTETPDEPPQPRKKAKTKIGNKSKRKRKVKTTGKFPGGDGEEQYEVRIILFILSFMLIIFLEYEIHIFYSLLLAPRLL